MRILHISDAHFGLLSPDGARDVIQAALLEATASLNYDVVVFSGDVANRGDASEYAQAKLFLAELLRGKPLLLVPGNHDVNRAVVTASRLADAASILGGHPKPASRGHLKTGQ